MNKAQESGLVSIYRVYNRSSEVVRFKKRGGSTTSLGPGSAVDVLSAEIDDSASFADLETSGKISKQLDHAFSADDILLQELLAEVDSSNAQEMPDSKPMQAAASSASLATKQKPAAKTQPKKRVRKKEAAKKTTQKTKK